MDSKLNQFRQDLATGDWILFAASRAQHHLSGRKEKFYQAKEECPFEDLSVAQVYAAYKDGSKVDWPSDDLPAGEAGWTVVSIQNKYPALQYGVCSEPRQEGLFVVADAFGFHELVITRDHEKTFTDLTPSQIHELLIVYKDRMTDMMKDSCGEYVLVFHNSGPGAGATVYHNHTQIISFPFIPPEIGKAMESSIKFHSHHGQRLTDKVLDWEMAEGTRVIARNERCVAICPYVSRTPYEVRIFPIEHKARFEMSDGQDLECAAELLLHTLQSLQKVFGPFDYNFYIHSAPAKPTYDDFYRWHIEIVPRLSMVGALELGTYVFTNVVDPDEASESLRTNMPARSARLPDGQAGGPK